MTPVPVASNGSGHAVVRASEADIDVLSQVIADAFFGLAVSKWLIADTAARREIFPGYFRLYVEHAITAGIVYTTPAETAAALWVPIDEEGPRPPYDYGARLAAVTGQWLSQFQAFDLALDRHHPAEFAHHHHLAILAVRPDMQGHGIGTALLNAHHTVIDRDGIPAYLEASSIETRRIYLRHGYLDYGTGILLSDAGPRMYPMVRQPRGSSQQAR